MAASWQGRMQPAVFRAIAFKEFLLLLLLLNNSALFNYPVITSVKAVINKKCRTWDEKHGVSVYQTSFLFHFFF